MICTSGYVNYGVWTVCIIHTIVYFVDTLPYYDVALILLLEDEDMMMRDPWYPKLWWCNDSF